MSAMKHELALFHPGATEKAIKEVKWINHRPSTQINNNGPLEFNITGNSSEYVLLSKKIRTYDFVEILHDLQI